MISRRQFFKRFWNQPDKVPSRGPEERHPRYEALETYVRTHLLPYDIEISAEQESELFALVRLFLERLPEEELFGLPIRGRLESLVNFKVESWREAMRSSVDTMHIDEVRKAAVDYVRDFVRSEGGTVLEQLRLRMGATDLERLESELKARIHAWMEGELSQEELLDHDVLSIREPVYARLRSWC